MKTIALRFADNFAPKCGTIEAHRQMIEKNGFVWYGKLGNSVSSKVAEEILSNEECKILLIHSGKINRYWAKVVEINSQINDDENIPEYYRNTKNKFKTWFKVTSIEEAKRNVMSKCTIASSGAPLSEVSKHSMSPYFIINYSEE